MDKIVFLYRESISDTLASKSCAFFTEQCSHKE